MARHRITVNSSAEYDPEVVDIIIMRFFLIVMLIVVPPVAILLGRLTMSVVF